MTLTPRQQQVCELAVQGLTHKEIAIRLGISHRTVEDHITRAFEVFGVRNKVGLLYRLMQTQSGSGGPLQ